MVINACTYMLAFYMAYLIMRLLGIDHHAYIIYYNSSLNLSSINVCHLALVFAESLKDQMKDSQYSRHQCMYSAWSLEKFVNYMTLFYRAWSFVTHV